jgi:phosphotransferase system enzyme I (PtsP)
MTPSAVTPEGSLLLTLEEISQLISHSHDPNETLANIVRLIQGRFHTDACSVYMLEPDRGELVLGATVGLKPECVGQVCMRLDEGLTGLAAQTLAPVMVDDAFQHPRFKYFPEAGEDPYHSFLGIPLIEGGAVQGVLVVQTLEPRRFSANEQRMLVTVASQLAPLVIGARLLKRVVAAAHPPAAPSREPSGPTVLQGVTLSPGAGAGESYLVTRFEEWVAGAPPRSHHPELEKQRLARALDAARDEVTRQSQRISALVGEDHGAILQAHLMLLQDRTLGRDLDELLADGHSAESALLTALDQYVKALEKVSTPFFQERVYDVKDVFRRVLWHLRPQPNGAGGAARLVLVAQEASVLDLFAVDLDRLAAVVVERGGAQSHAAILARSLGVPMVGQVAGATERIQPGQRLFVDATAGRITLNCGLQIADCGLKSSSQSAIRNPQSAIPVGPPRSDLPQVQANINLLREAAQAVEQDAAGVGLYRTEFLFLARRTLPTEEEQVGIYCKLLTRLEGRPVSIRTFDLRPNKLVHSTRWAPSAAEALDWRRLLESPPLQKLFKDQVRAILRAAVAGPARILVPLVTRTEQLNWIVDTVGRARDELREEGLPFGDAVPLGVMIEVAGAVPLIEGWAANVDAFAVGTNDLIASALGIDRDDPVGAARQDFLHPGVLRLLQDAVTQAHRAGRRITVCGEMANDPAGALALAALEVDALSVPVHQIAATRLVLHQFSPQRLDFLAEQLPRTRTTAQARELLQV